MKSLLISAIALLPLANALAQNMPLVEEKSTRVSDHVYAIVGFPNIAIVVGSRATLVVDTGLGPRNGATAMRVVKKLAMGQKLFLTTTHFHVEHTAGEAAFPAETILIRPAVQQAEVEKSVPGMIARFSTFSAQNRELLAGVKLGAPDLVFGVPALIGWQVLEGRALQGAVAGARGGRGR